MTTLILLTWLLVQPPASPPTLTEVQRLKLQVATQRIELAQLRAQQAQREFEAARDEVMKMMAELKVEGYTLDLQSLSYKRDEPKK